MDDLDRKRGGGDGDEGGARGHREEGAMIGEDATELGLELVEGDVKEATIEGGEGGLKGGEGVLQSR